MIIFFHDRDMLMNWSPKNKKHKKTSSKLGHELGILPTTCELSLFEGDEEA
jgi:hypothetical protein